MPVRLLAILSGLLLVLPWLMGGCVDSERAAEQAPASTDRETTMPADDPFVWLEERRGARALSWVHHQNELTLQRLTRDPLYHRLREASLAVARDDSRIPSSGWMHRGRIYNFWQDDKHPRGLLRYTSLDSFRTGSPGLAAAPRHRSAGAPRVAKVELRVRHSLRSRRHAPVPDFSFRRWGRSCCDLARAGSSARHAGSRRIRSA